MKTYDNEQLRAIEARGGHYLVLAPPGCGKTDILSERVVRARERGVPDDDMLCLTFTNRASRGMRERVRKKLGDEPCRIFVGNVHRYCSHLLWDNNLLPESTAVIDDDELTDLLTRQDPQLFITKNGSPHRSNIALVDHIDSYISQRINGHPREAIFLPEDDFEQYFRKAIAAHLDPALVVESPFVKYALMFRRYKLEHQLISFNDLLILAFDALRRDTARKLKRFSWIQVDEVQDLNALQMAIIDLLLNRDSDYTVMYLGDEQQAIFSFMGAKLEQLALLRGRCAGNIFTLGVNYRSPQYLLDIFNTYAEKELGIDPSLLPQSNRDALPGKYDLILTGNDTESGQDGRLESMIRFYQGQGENERVALLVPTNAAADRVSAHLKSKGIGHFKISGTDMFRSKSFKTLAAFFCVSVDDFNRMAWVRLMQGTGVVSTAVEAMTLVTDMKRVMMTPSDLMNGESYIEHFIKEYNKSEFVFFDTETTGLNVLEDDIVQIAAFKVRDGERVEGSEFNIFLHTDREIPSHLGDLVNPLVDAYANNPHLDRAEGLNCFLDYIGDCPLLGHNVAYDYCILQKNVERELHKQVTFDIYDSLHLAKCVKPDLRMYKLAHLIQELHLEGENSHLADQDIAATKALIDFCYAEACGVVHAQRQFIQQNIDVAHRMAPLKAMFDKLQEDLYQPVSSAGRTLADELRDTYNAMVAQELVKPLDKGKLDLFIRYVEDEWTDPNVLETLHDQISNHLNDMATTINEGDLINSKYVTDSVFVMTVHKGKGLEFDNVVVMDASEGVYPYVWTRRRMNSANPKMRKQAESEMKEDARKFYVALSRAKKRLCVSYVSEMTPFMMNIRHYFNTGRS